MAHRGVTVKFLQRPQYAKHDKKPRSTMPTQVEPVQEEISDVEEEPGVLEALMDEDPELAQDEDPELASLFAELEEPLPVKVEASMKNSKAELIAIAQELGIVVNSEMTKKEILALIEA